MVQAGDPKLSDRLDATDGPLTLALRASDFPALHESLRVLARRADCARMTLLLPLADASPELAGLVSGAAAALTRETALDTVAVIEGEAAIVGDWSAPDGRFAHWRVADGTRRLRALQSVTALPAASADTPGDLVAVVAGGMGALGRASIAALAGAGWRRFALLGRSETPDFPPNEAMSAEIIRYFACDVGSETEVHTALETIRSEIGPIGAVIQAAGVLDDRLLGTQDDASVAAVLRPKLAGTKALDNLTRDDPLRLFLLHGSIVGLLGNAGQTAYAAANAAAQALMEERGRENAPGASLTLCWSFVEGGGMGDASTASAFRKAGWPPVTLGQARSVLDQAVSLTTSGTWAVFGAPMAAAAAQTPEITLTETTLAAIERQDAVPLEDIRALIRARAAGFLGEDADAISETASFFDLGLGSMQLQELAGELESRFEGVSPTVLFQYTSVDALCAHLATLTPRAAAEAVPETRAAIAAGAAAPAYRSLPTPPNAPAPSPSSG
ncbi:beta-ketoacyl reductase [Breoghania sp. L-A4]|uniref:beta-ketoacyl reductase n=1 Tax=Breoghania sp. L-A4 TaxID=2304600 RepID=UPI0013C2BF57|nr:beta-ketoacyl reductase [Breoghania sp. L-A4]